MTAHFDSARALSEQLVVVPYLDEMLEASIAKGIYHTVLKDPYESDRAEFIHLRDTIAQLEDQALRSLVRSQRIDLFGQADELQKQMDMIDLRVLREDEFPNVVCTVGKNVMLDAALAGSSYTVVGPYLGLISSVSWSAVAAGDTMSSHGGWTEAGNANAPPYTAPRKTCAWSAASGGAKSLSSALSFAITNTGTVKGCFIVYFTGASSTIDNTSGTLYSAGQFTGGDQGVVNGNTLNVSYTTSL